MIELSLTHDGHLWIARGESWTAEGETLEELDLVVAKIARERERPDDGSRLEIRMTFNNEVIPEWIRQYSQHYFNRLITIDFPPARTGESAN